MQATVGDVHPKTLESAKRQFVELYGSALVRTTYLKIARVLVSLGLTTSRVGSYAEPLPKRRVWGGPGGR